MRKRTTRKRTTQIFKNSVAHQSHYSYIPTLPGMRLDLCAEAFTRVPAKQEAPATLADVRKAHVQYWALVAEECKSLEFGFTL